MIEVHLTTSKKWVFIPSLIRKFSNGRLFTHAAFKFTSKTWNTSFYYQNTVSKTQFMGEVQFKKNNHIVEVFELKLPKKVEQQLIKICQEREGKPYSFLGIFGKMLMKIFKLNSNPFQDGDKTTDCIEEITMALIIAKKIVLDKNIDTIDLDDFYEILKKVGTKKCNTQAS